MIGSVVGNGRVVRIVVADDHAIVRDGLRALIQAQPGLSVVGEAANADEAVERARDLNPDVLVLDLSMPGTRAAEATGWILADCPSVRVLALTMHEERGYVSQVLRAGASGYMLKRTAASELLRAIRTVAEGGTYLDGTLAAPLFRAMRPRSSPRSSRGGGTAMVDLTGREVEVFHLVARGHTNKEIARTLEISVKTVETHKANAMSKLGLSSRAALVQYALDAGWLRDA